MNSDNNAREMRTSGESTAPMIDLVRTCLTLWSVRTSKPSPQLRTPVRLSQAEHIREFGEPCGSNGA